MLEYARTELRESGRVKARKAIHQSCRSGVGNAVVDKKLSVIAPITYPLCDVLGWSAISFRIPSISETGRQSDDPVKVGSEYRVIVMKPAWSKPARIIAIKVRSQAPGFGEASHHAG